MVWQHLWLPQPGTGMGVGGGSGEGRWRGRGWTEGGCRNALPEDFCMLNCAVRTDLP